MIVPPSSSAYVPPSNTSPDYDPVVFQTANNQKPAASNDSTTKKVENLDVEGLINDYQKEVEKAAKKDKLSIKIQKKKFTNLTRKSTGFAIFGYSGLVISFFVAIPIAIIFTPLSLILLPAGIAALVYGIKTSGKFGDKANQAAKNYNDAETNLRKKKIQLEHFQDPRFLKFVKNLNKEIRIPINEHTLSSMTVHQLFYDENKIIDYGNSIEKINESIEKNKEKTKPAIEGSTAGDKVIKRWMDDRKYDNYSKNDLMKKITENKKLLKEMYVKND